VEVAKKDAGVGEQVGFDPEQFSGLPKPLLAVAQQLLSLPMSAENMGEHVSRGHPRVVVGETMCRLVKEIDGAVADVGLLNPGSKVDDVIR
jgi:hypothetical protein